MHGQSRAESKTAGVAAADVLGVDIGSVAISMALLNVEGRLQRSAYAVHHGAIRETLRTLLAELGLDEVPYLARTAGSPETLRSSASYDNHICTITAAKRLHDAVGSILLVGGERFSLIRFDEHGHYADTKSNSSCAAGTGSFLDQQARNLGFKDSAELSAAALTAEGEPPKIASRCAVFAKTDLIHAQQQGYSRASIADGLCHGMATNIVDGLFSGEDLVTPIVLAGGVARNEAVARHLSELIGSDLVVHGEPHLYGALGAAWLLHEALASTSHDDASPRPEPLSPCAAADLMLPLPATRSYHHPPLDLALSRYPDFASERRYLYTPRVVVGGAAVEVDIYALLGAGTRHRVYFGLDIGSTSTKGVLLDIDGDVLAGFYTRTAGQPMRAAQTILEAITDWTSTANIELDFVGAGTTGSGRKFIGSIIGVDLVVDEITAHARAAFELDPQVDTIIEIGGQDAKFTTLREGMVTSAVMNTVCAAGTGSFIEEQARRLGCPLESYAEQVVGMQAPMASDRCTVFMQRDLSHLLSEGYSVPETLASVLHAVRENYLTKVAREGDIGHRVCFQGATAKNRALVAAFEQRLQQPILVSRYCHLTGALGVALLLREQAASTTAFKGLSLAEAQIPMRQEICELCTNHCKLVLAEVQDEIAAYGFLCGRDYDVERYVSRNKSGFDLLKARMRAPASRVEREPRVEISIGLPAALHLFEEIELWRTFFAELGIRTVTLDKRGDLLRRGKTLARAEFCAPMSAFYGAVDALAEQADYLFLPLRFESAEAQGETRHQYCYYSQYATALAAQLHDGKLRDRCLMPSLGGDRSSLQKKLELYRMLQRILPREVGFSEVARAHNRAVAVREREMHRLRDVFREQQKSATDISVVLLGRPYTVLAPSMNKGIPDIFSALGVKTFYQDMVPPEATPDPELAPLLAALPWHYASKILETAMSVAKTPGVYPVLVTSFKCTPDSCVVDYFRRLFDRRRKPYLILQLDDHDSAIGYETRIEAAVRSFRNHHARPTETATAPSDERAIYAPTATALDGKTLLLPNWDHLTCRLLAANLEREGVDVRLIEEDTQVIRNGLRRNVGQCIPLNAIVQGFADYVRRHELDPARTLLWTMKSTIACNIGAYPAALHSVLASYGPELDGAQVYAGELTFADISLRGAINAYFAYLFGGTLRRLVCKVQPYELSMGDAEEAEAASVALFERAFRGDLDKLVAVDQVVARFEAIPVRIEPRPKVAIFGDLYVRDNDVMNQQLVRTIVRHGGEVVTTPYSEYAKLIASLYLRKWRRQGEYFNVFKASSLLATVQVLERRYMTRFARVLGPVPSRRPQRSPEELLAQFSLTEKHTGESMDNILKIYHLLDLYPDISLFVQANPAFCCPALVTEAMRDDIERLVGVPFVTITYDGTSSPRNDVVAPYLRYARKRSVPIVDAPVKRSRFSAVRFPSIHRPSAR